MSADRFRVPTVSPLRFSANLGFLWPDRPLPARIHAAAKAGFGAVECHWPYDCPPAQILKALNATGLTMLSLNTPPGDPKAGDFGLGAVPGREQEAREGICRAADYACRVGATHIHAMAGICEDPRVALHRMYDHLAWAAEVARSAGLNILIEPINRSDRPGYALFRTSQAIDLIHRLERQEGIGNVRLMFDCYHVQMTEGNLLTRLTEALPWVDHIQVAGVPGRNEPTHCEIDYGWLFGQMSRLEYPGWIGAEYLPAGNTQDGLSWYQPYRPEPVRSAIASPRVFRHLSQSDLDAEYNNQAKVADFGDYLTRYIRRSEATRAELTGYPGLSYGPSAAEALDIFRTGVDGNRIPHVPVHVFFHGGYWQALSKDDFSFVANATRGMDALCVVVNYALLPEVEMDELVSQCRRSLIWLWHHAMAYGGDPSRIVISGHSAGGHLVAMMAATDWPALESGCPADLVKGGLSVSGLMDLEPIRLCYLNEGLKLDAPTSSRNSPLQLKKPSNTPLVCVYGDQEGQEYRRQSEALAARWENTHAQSLKGHDHFSLVMLLDDPKSALSGMLRSMMVKGPDGDIDRA